jgi:hypothetical protein
MTVALRHSSSFRKDGAKIHNETHIHEQTGRQAAVRTGASCLVP